MIKDRILRGWTFRRGLYLAIGVFVLVQSAIQNQWLGVVFGAYFASMGIFSFGCAGGNCLVDPKQKSNSNSDEVEYEEIK